MDRVILHADLNNFYASVECLYQPALRNVPMAVGGDVQKRHGIVLAKNNIAKRMGVKTGEALWEAREKCPDIQFVSPSFDKYLRFSKEARSIYEQYTEQVESFGLDECWLDITKDISRLGSGKKVADEIRWRIQSELGITASVGVSFNKIFAKLGSDMKKPDATTVITRENFRQKIFPLPASDLLYVGPATSRKLKRYGITTIGALAQSDVGFLKNLLGVNGVMLWQFANGMDTAPVAKSTHSPAVKSVGNSTTLPYDVTKDEDVRLTLYVLSESVAERLREYGFSCRCVALGIRQSNFYSYERQGKLPFPTHNSEDIFRKAFWLYKQKRMGNDPIRSLSVRAMDLTSQKENQLCLLEEYAFTQKHEKAEQAIDSIRSRFGHYSVQRAVMLTNPSLSRLDPKNEHTIHPVSFLKGESAGREKSL